MANRYSTFLSKETKTSTQELAERLERVLIEDESQYEEALQACIEKATVVKGTYNIELHDCFKDNDLKDYYPFEYNALNDSLLKYKDINILTINKPTNLLEMVGYVHLLSTYTSLHLNWFVIENIDSTYKQDPNGFFFKDVKTVLRYLRRNSGYTERAAMYQTLLILISSEQAMNLHLHFKRTS